MNFSLSHDAIVWIKELIQNKIANQQALLLMMHATDDFQRNRVQSALRRLEDYRTKIGAVQGEVISDVAASLRG